MAVIFFPYSEFSRKDCDNAALAIIVFTITEVKYASITFSSNNTMLSLFLPTANLSTWNL
jgi:hypothetical protein